MLCITNFDPVLLVNRLLGMLDDFEDDVVGLTNMDEVPQHQSNWPSSGKSPKKKSKV